MLQEQRNSKKQGDVGFGVAVGWFAEKGHTVCLPLTDSQDFDLVVEMDGELKKVQVKTTYHKSPHGVYMADLRTHGGNRSGNTVKKFEPSKVDLLFVLTEGGDKYLIPADKVNAMSVFNLGKKAEAFRV